MSWFNSTTIIVDDTSSTIVYTPGGGAWPQVVVPASVGAYNNTLTEGEEPGFSYTFTFTGVAIDVYGVVTENLEFQPSSTYTVDETPSVTFTPPSVTETTANVLFFRSPPLEQGSHTLHVSIFAFHSTYFLDYILYTPGDVTQSAALAKREVSALLQVPAGDDDGGKLYNFNSSFKTVLAGCLAVAGVLLLYTFLRRRAQRSWKALQSANALGCNTVQDA